MRGMVLRFSLIAWRPIIGNRRVGHGYASACGVVMPGLTSSPPLSAALTLSLSQREREWAWRWRGRKMTPMHRQTASGSGVAGADMVG